MSGQSVISEIKRDLDEIVGMRIRVRANRGRRRIVEREGTLERTYANHFLIRLDDKHAGNRRVSYNYADLLTEVVELTVCGQDGERKLTYHGQ